MRRPLVLLVNLLLTASSYFIALGLRFDFATEEFLNHQRLTLPLLLLLTMRHASYMYWNINQGFWRYFSAPDLKSLLKAHTASTCVFTAFILLLRVGSFPRSVIFIEFVLGLCFVSGARLLVRTGREYLLARSSASELGSTYHRDVIVLGAGDSGHLLVKHLLSLSTVRYNPIAVLDDSKRLKNSQVHGISVVGPLSALPDILESNKSVSLVFIAIPSLGKNRILEIEQICNEANVLIKRLQSFEDIACLDATLPETSLSIEAVLHKQPVVQHEKQINDAISGKRILVTGAGGSIGSELVRQILRFEPKSLVLLDNCEYNLFKLQIELRDNKQITKTEIIPCIATIADHKRLNRVFSLYRPEYVFHAAAYKHVPLMEYNPYEAFKNNVIGTKNVLDACHKYDTSRLVLISTDKAVDPSSIMGSSKRLAELILQEYAQQSNGHKRVEVAMVRFGNVINSAGSVIPLWKEQIAKGGPVTVTHPKMRRFFMSIREAVRLILTSGTLGKNGTIFVLDMGEAIYIKDVAEKMLALYGKTDIEIVYTGVRPGEKLSEQLTEEHEPVASTKFDKVYQVQNLLTTQNLAVRKWIDELDQKIYSLSDKDISDEIYSFIVHSSNILKPTAAQVA